MERALSMFSQQLKLREIRVEQTLEENLPLVLGDANRLEQVFVNLLINARDAIEEKAEKFPGVSIEKKISLRTRSANGKVTIEVEDTGIGIPKAFLDKIFEPFFTTKQIGKGTGLGLSISYGIVQDYDGTINVKARDGEGATFVIQFPVAGDRVLLVDDEEGIRKMLRLSLMESGYDVQVAACGEEALALFEREPYPIVLTDIKMPGMDGIELLQRIKRQSADTEVIMITGHGDMELAIKSLQHDASDFITKPVRDEALEVALRRARERIWMKRKLQEYTQNLEQMVHDKIQKLLEAERLAAIGEVVTLITHSVKNIICGLEGGIYVIERGKSTGDEKSTDDGWEMIKTNVARIGGLAGDLLNYAKERQPACVLCDPNVPPREVFELMLPRAKDCGIDLQMDLCPDIKEAYLDPEGIHNCLLNLVNNAVDACAGRDCAGGKVVIRSIKETPWAVAYQVQDNGSGMDKRTREKVFRRFFSTKGRKGTGLGLMITRKIVHEHQGRIEFESAKGKGTTFTLRFPRLKEGDRSPVNSMS
jgi:signal transduction histidine kinase